MNWLPKNKNTRLMAICATVAVSMVGAAYAVISVLILFAGLEAFAGFCAGCFVFGYLIRFGLIPAKLCQRCADLNFHIPGRSEA